MRRQACHQKSAVHANECGLGAGGRRTTLIRICPAGQLAANTAYEHKDTIAMKQDTVMSKSAAGMGLCSSRACMWRWWRRLPLYRAFTPARLARPAVTVTGACPRGLTWRALDHANTMITCELGWLIVVKYMDVGYEGINCQCSLFIIR
eukprot:6174314-Pleurochrysis_carterae.AAC.1